MDLHRAVLGRGVHQRHLQAQLLLPDRRLHEDVGGIDAPGHDRAGRRQDARLARVIRADGKIEELVDPVLRAHPGHRRIEEHAAALAGLLLAEGVVRILDDDADLVDLARPDRAGHVAFPLRKGRLGPAAELAVHVDAGDQAQRRELQEERAAGQPGGHVHPRAIDEAVAEPQLGLDLELVARHRDRHPIGRGHVGQGLGRSGAIRHLLFVETADLPEPGQRGLDPSPPRSAPAPRSCPAPCCRCSLP